MARVGLDKRFKTIWRMMMRSYDYHRQARIDKAIDKTGGVYPGGNGDDYLHSGLPGVGYVATRWSRAVSTEFVCTKAEFESRKAERQNKPSWNKAPAWVNWAAQDEEGRWFWYSKKPEVDGLEFVEPSNDGKVIYAASAGEVIGNWQDTLEQRPEVKSDPQVTRRSYAQEHRAAFDKFADSVCSKMFGPEAYHNAKQLNELLSDAQTKPSLFEPWTCLEIPAKADWYDYENQQAIKLPPVGLKVSYFDDSTFVSVGGDRSWRSGDELDVLAHTVVNGDKICVVFNTKHETAQCLVTECIRPLDWDRLSPNPNPEPEESPELSFHLATAQNELTSSAKLLPAESKLLQSITGVIAAIQAIREAV